MSGKDRDTTRRTVLRAIGVSAATAATVAGTASASGSDHTQPDVIVEDESDLNTSDHCTKYTETDCQLLGSCVGKETEYERYCTKCDDGSKSCTEWSETGRCCL